MKKTIVVSLALLAALPAFAEVPAELLKKEEPSAASGGKKLFEGGESFSYSSDEVDPSESLNRVAGEIDLGFAAPDQVYKSDKQRMGLDKTPGSTQY